MGRKFIGIPGSSGSAGTVTSVSGTANQIDVATGTTTPALSLSSTLVAPGTVTATTSVAAPFFASTNADVADSGAIRLGNAEAIAWEASPAGTDVTLSVDSSEIFQFSNAAVFPVGSAGAPSISPRAGSAIGIWSSGTGQLSLNTASATSTIGMYAAAVNIANFSFTATAATLLSVPTNSTLVFQHNLTSTVNSFGTVFSTPNPYTGTSGQFFHTESRGNFGPTSGTAGMYGLMVDPVINTTSTYSGIVAGVGIYPILSSTTGATVRALGIGTSSTVGPNGTLTTNYSIDTSGVNKIYAGIATVSQGHPTEYATSDLTAQAAAIGATTLYAVPAGGQGMYRISWSATITTVDGAASVLGGAGGFQVIYTSPTDSVVKTTVSGNSVTSAANTTGTAIGGTQVVYAKLSTNIQYSFGYTSTTPGQMIYELHIKLESL